MSGPVFLKALEVCQLEVPLAKFKLRMAVMDCWVLLLACLNSCMFDFSFIHHFKLLKVQVQSKFHQVSLSQRKQTPKLFFLSFYSSNFKSQF
jgi:hypothetical protein